MIRLFSQLAGWEQILADLKERTKKNISIKVNGKDVLDQQPKEHKLKGDSNENEKN